MEAADGRARLSGGGSQLVFFALAYGVAFIAFAGQVGRRHLRFALALWAGGVASHLGWALLHLPDFVDAPTSIFLPGAASALFFPLGVLLVAPWREALATLPAALFVVRLGCLANSCCYVTPPDAVLELAGLAALGVAVRCWPHHTTVLVLSGLGALRVACEPLRATGPDPWLDPAWVGIVWIGVGALLQPHIRSIRDPDSAAEPELAGTLAAVLWVQVAFFGASVVIDDTASATLVAAFLATAIALAVVRPAIASAAVARGIAVGVLCACGVAAVAPFPVPFSDSGPGSGTGWTWLLAAGLLAPLFEEFLYRGRLLPALRPVLGDFGAVVASSGVAAIAHVRVAAMPAPFALGIVTGALVLRTGSLGLAVGVHMGWNLTWLVLAI